MSWLSSSWKYRASITVDNSAGTTAAHDVTITLPTEWAKFYAKCNQTDARDVRVTLADGVTLATYDLESFTVSGDTGTLTLELDNVSMTAANIHQLFLYWGNSGATDAQSAVTTSSPKTGYVAVESPDPAYTVKVGGQAFGQTQPTAKLAKLGNDARFVWFDFGDALQKWDVPTNGHREREEIDRVSLVNVLTTGGSDTPSMYTAGSTRIVAGRYVGAYVMAGSSGSEYTVVVRVVTTTNGGVSRTLEGRASLYVYNLLET